MRFSLRCILWTCRVYAQRYWFSSCANNASGVQRRIDVRGVTKQILCSLVVSVWDGAVCVFNLGSDDTKHCNESVATANKCLTCLFSLGLGSAAAAWTCRETTTRVTPPGSSGSTPSGQILLRHWNVSFLLYHQYDLNELFSLCLLLVHRLREHHRLQGLSSTNN